jgi:S-formylglutathione hydrolase FrmB
MAARPPRVQALVMLRRRRRAVAAIVGLVAAGAATAGALEIRAASPAPAQPGGRPLGLSFPSRALGGRLALSVYLPPGYATSGLRYPVIYFLHGLPASPVAYRQVGFLARSLDRLHARALLVAPQGARDGDSDPEYLDWGPGRNWETALAKEVPAFVDRRFRTLASRRGRALVGLSAGGYGAVLLALHHLTDFSVVESWSGYQHPTTPAGTAPLDLGSPAANAHASAHTFVPELRRAFARRPTFFAFYVGRGDARFRAENERLDRELDRAGVPHVFRLYPGAHEIRVWTAHADAWLGTALDHLAPARAGG